MFQAVKYSVETARELRALPDDELLAALGCDPQVVHPADVREMLDDTRDDLHVLRGDAIVTPEDEKLPHTVTTDQLVVQLTFYVRENYDEDGEPEGWMIATVESAQLVARTPERLTLRAPRSRSCTRSYEWDAYRYDFGGELGEQWAYGSSAELLRVWL